LLISYRLTNTKHFSKQLIQTLWIVSDIIKITGKMTTKGSNKYRWLKTRKLTCKYPHIESETDRAKSVTLSQPVPAPMH
jgi:hypothetical protein